MATNKRDLSCRVFHDFAMWQAFPETSQLSQELAK
jgi:hypothetical protein